ncbi:hypothetical protein [Nocardia sp. BMG51109]|uniref:hypothetical protein n=1 Tax=Nocardia sp. BMG51109 TaxID=1056816 RepID=UPI000463E090|nr:hypothetical protein [Nocardia sp. BMG51109]
MPDPILVAIAAALAGKGVGNLYDLVREKFAGRSEAKAALEAARDADAESPQVEVLSEELARTEREDPQFSAELRALWQEISVAQRADRDGVVNQISGDVSGKVVQARDIEGGISF